MPMGYTRLRGGFVHTGRRLVHAGHHLVPFGQITPDSAHAFLDTFSKKYQPGGAGARGAPRNNKASTSLHSWAGSKGLSSKALKPASLKRTKS